jgi:hypothetical protein
MGIDSCQDDTTKAVEPEFKQILPKWVIHSYYGAQTGAETKFRANWRTEGQDDGEI